jgi:ribosomal protein S18 acetylase RimI-like enzyme
VRSGGRVDQRVQRLAITLAVAAARDPRGHVDDQSAGGGRTPGQLGVDGQQHGEHGLGRVGLAEVVGPGEQDADFDAGGGRLRPVRGKFLNQGPAGANAKASDSANLIAMVVIERLDRAGLERELDALGALLHACVEAGASVGFVQPFTPDDARVFWRHRIGPGVTADERQLFVARLDGEVVGTAQLDLAAMPNQRHRADVSKVLVHPKARRRGIARTLMDQLHAEAARQGRWLLTLDTRSGDAAEPLYLSLGYQAVGEIPVYARAPDEARFDATTVMFKLLERPRE